MTTPDVISALASAPLAGWQPAPAPWQKPLWARSKASEGCVLHSDTWLVRDIHGADYEWAPVKAL